MSKIYILRDEGISVFREIRKNTGTESKKFDAAYCLLWKNFIGKLTELITKYSSSKVTVVIHSLEYLEKKKKQAIKGKQAITLDSYSTIYGAFVLGISRIFEPGGINKIGIGPRPGYPPIPKQLETLKRKRGNKSFVLVEDDVFSGGTLSQILNYFDKHNIKIEKIIVGTEVVKSNKDRFPNLKSIFKYPETDVFELNDPRDFLLGTYEAGLVIKLPLGSARAPYFLPFVDPTERCGIAKRNAVNFSKSVLEINKQAYSEIEKLTNKKIKLTDTSKSFIKFIHYFFKNKKDYYITKLIEKLKLKL